jgi:hypothetical protein
MALNAYSARDWRFFGSKRNGGIMSFLASGKDFEDHTGCKTIAAQLLVLKARGILSAVHELWTRANIGHSNITQWL